MKKLNSIFFLFSFLLIFSCSEDSEDPYISNDSKNLQNSESILESERMGFTSQCISTYFINLNATAVYNERKYIITWNPNVLRLNCRVSEYRLEFFDDKHTDPNTGIYYPNGVPGSLGWCGDIIVNTSREIDLNSGEYIASIVGVDGIHTKCLWYRLVAEGSSCGDFFGTCYSETEWKFITYSQ